MATAIGLPGKIGGQGSEVAAMVARGEIEQVRAYCEADCLNLFALYVRWALLSGRTDVLGHDASLASLVRCLEGERGDRPHLGEFLDRWRASSRPAPMYVADEETASSTAACVPAPRQRLDEPRSRLLTLRGGGSGSDHRRLLARRAHHGRLYADHHCICCRCKQERHRRGPWCPALAAVRPSRRRGR